MSEQSVTRRLPDGQPQGLDPAVFRTLLQDAVRSYLAALRGQTPTLARREVFRETKDGVASTEIAFPAYHKPDDTVIGRAQSLPAIRALLDYVWERGEMSYTLTGPDPQRRDWEYYVHCCKHEFLV